MGRPVAAPDQPVLSPPRPRAMVYQNRPEPARWPGRTPVYRSILMIA
jgi:hypothetical protein